MNEKLAELLAQLAAKLGTTVEHLWAVLVHQAKVEALVSIGWDIAAVVYVALLIKKLPGWFQAVADYDDEGEGGKAFCMLFGAVAGVVVGVVAFIGIIATVGTTVTQLANPEYWALKEILEVLK